MAATCAAYARRCPPSLTARLAPSIVEVLASLSDWTRPGLVTGNYEPIARLKLLRAGIDASTWPGAFGSDSESRADLPPLARTRAGANGVAWPRERTVVVGDTPRDIACARADGLRVVAIATGPHPLEAPGRRRRGPGRRARAAGGAAGARLTAGSPTDPRAEGRRSCARRCPGAAA